MVDESGTPVSIHGEEFKIRGAEPERIRALAEFVDARFREMEKASRTHDLRRQAVLVSLNIAEEVFRERERRLDDQERTRYRLRECSRYLDGALEESGPAGS
ncbi:MAG: cell division protein ZapA [Candidatus Eisenbacteria bacterium]